MPNKITNEPITKLTTGLWQFRVLVAGLKLDIFSVVSKPRTVKDIAKKLKIKADPAERLLNALVAMELLEKKGNSYFNTPVAEKFLVKDSPDYFGDFVLMFEESDESWKKLDQAIIKNAPVIVGHRDRFRTKGFTRAMHNNAQAPAKALSGLIDFSDKKHLLDIGAGSGAFSIILTNKFESLKATIIELPSVCQTAKEYVKKDGDLEKINLIKGDYFKVEYPPHDIALFGQIFHSNSPAQNKDLLKKVYEKLEDSGLVIITEFLLDKDKTGPLFPALFSLNMLKQLKDGRSYTFSEIKKWLENIGFKNIKKKRLVGPHTAIIAYK